MSDYAVKITVRNGRILRQMRKCGIESQAELARRAGVCPNVLNTLVCMRDKAYNAKGEWRRIAFDIASALQCEPEDLFNDQQRERALERNSAEVFMDAGQVQAIMADNAEETSWAKIETQRLLSALPSERMRKVVTCKMEGATYDQVAEEVGLSKERVRQIEQQAHRMMRMAASRSDKECASKLVYGAD